MEFNITRSWDRPKSFRVESIISQFTLDEVKLEKHFTGNLPIEAEPWSVGVIVGRSGTGKSTIAKQLFPDSYIRGFEYREPSILDDFPEGLSTSDITRALGSVGFSSPPDWLTFNSRSVGFDSATYIVDSVSIFSSMSALFACLG